MEVWNHYEGYHKAYQSVRDQSLEDDLELLDSLFGRDELPYGATPEQVKEEALRQCEIEWRSSRNELAELMVAAHGGTL